ncbi:MAG: 50S ribosomal protein L17 [Bacteroidales bacterium]|nr:50S ribosomal protein L17 [Bacteroidales bacterium]
MRHRRKINHLSRKSAHRKAMLANMATSLILHKRINTTLAKAKALRSYIEPLITKSKDDNTHSRRVVFSYLQSKQAVTELFRDISVKIADRPGGYTRIIKTGTRLGDNAEMCMMELVDFNETMLAEKGVVAKTSRRRRRGGAKKISEGEQQKEAVVAETTVEETTEVVEDKTEETVDEEVQAEKEEVKTEDKPEEPEAKEEVKTEDQPAEAKTKVEEKPETSEEEAEAKSEEPVAEAKEEEKKDETPKANDNEKQE